MNYSVAIFTDKETKDEALTAAKEALASVAQKYQCHFELRTAEKSSATFGKTPLSEKLQEKNAQNKDKGISFGGEIEL